MKKLFLSLLLLALPLLASAYCQVDGIYYYLIPKGNLAEVTFGNTKYSGSVTIPEKFIYEGVEYSVTSIGYDAFLYCSGLTSVTIPNSVTSIGNQAFAGCSSLTSVTIPNSVTSIGGGAFINCSSLTSVTIPNSVTSIGNGAFAGCSSLTSVTIPNSVTSIGDAAFEGCTGLISITIPNSVTTIEYAVFSNCSSLTSVTIPNSVTSIGGSAFSNCSSLTSITIPNSVTSIGGSAFSNCSSLTSVTIPNSVTSIGGGAFYGCSVLTSVAIPNSVTSIESYAFSLCIGLTSVTIPNSVTSIGNEAFYGCSGLTSVTIPNSVTSIEWGAFSGCSGLTSIIVESGNTKYDSRDNCNAIIETSTNTLISGCMNTEIPISVTSIGRDAFLGCTGLTSVTIPNSVTSIGYRAFSGCSGLTSIIVESGNTKYDSRDNCNAIIETSTNTLISGCMNTEIPISVTSIGGFAFSGCSGLTSVTIPNSVTSIEGVAFQGCTGLTSVTIPNSVTSIEGFAFSGCRGLISVTFGSSVRSIGLWAFAECNKLEEVYCLAEKVPDTSTDAFLIFYPKYTTLYVPAESLNDYKTTEPWSQFGTIKGISGTGEEPTKCATPTISYADKRLTFSCETEGVEYVYEITDADIKKGYDAEVDLTATYEISVYATKAGYENSDIATATLVWTDAIFTVTTPETPTSAKAIAESIPVLISANGGNISVKCGADGQEVNVYSIDGRSFGSAFVKNGVATVNTSIQRGDIAIVKVGSKSVKVIMR